MNEIIDISQNHNDGGSLLGKDGLIQLWKMINDKFVATDCAGLLWSKDVDHDFMDNVSSKIEGSKVTLTFPTYNLYTKTAGSISTVFDIGSISSIATKDDLDQCVKKSILTGPNPLIIPMFDMSSHMLGFESRADDGRLSLNFYGSKDGETRIQVGYAAHATIPAVSDSGAGLMTPTMLSTLNTLSDPDDGAATKDDLDQCVKKSILDSNTDHTHIIPVFDMSLHVLGFDSGADDGRLLLNFYGSKDGENLVTTGYMARATIPAVSDSGAGLMTPAMLSTLNTLSETGAGSTPGGSISEDFDHDFVYNISSKLNGSKVTLTLPTYNVYTKTPSYISTTFDIGSISSIATKDDLDQCVKKSILTGSNPLIIPMFDTSFLQNNDLLTFDDGVLSLKFYGSNDGEAQDQTGYAAHATIPTVSSSSSGLMTPTMLSTLNSISSTGGGPVAKNDVNKDFFTGVSKSGTDIITLSFSTYNPSTKGTNTQTVSFDIKSDNRYIRKDTTDGQTMMGTLTSPAFYMTSDIALKRDIIDAPLPDKIASRMIQFKQFRYKQDDDLHYGVIAQEIEKILPQLVHENDGAKIVDYISLLCLKIQDLQDQINELKSKTTK